MIPICLCLSSAACVSPPVFVFEAVCFLSLTAFLLLTLPPLFCCRLSLQRCRAVDSAQGISLRSNVRAPPGCRQTGVSTGVDTRFRRNLQVMSLKHARPEVQWCAFTNDYLECLMETLFFLSLLEISVLRASPSF